MNDLRDIVSHEEANLMTDNLTTPVAPSPGIVMEFKEAWAQLPYKGLFLTLFGLWLVIFHFLGNSTLGYVNSPSLFVWLNWMYERAEDDRHGRLIPFVVLALFWWKRRQLLAVPKRHWWPAFGLFGLGIGLHILGYILQQTQISVVGFFLGLYGLTGLVWGPQWLIHSFFPFCLFVFCLPLANVGVAVTLPLRILASEITAVVCRDILGINVIQDGTRIFDSRGSYQYDVAAACSGIRSLTATLALSMIYAFTSLHSGWKRVVMILSAFPFAIAANVIRLSAIVTAAETFGKEAGNFVHSNSVLSLLPYIPAIIGIFVLGHFLKREKKTLPLAQPLGLGAESK
ncbi:MAG TPA: exosortase/archaeosortase family protein [Verrucomicrobiae bacterium]|nr:exosortase/archaeosortase family protein [Verrucomicrobiae bacterium]